MSDTNPPEQPESPTGEPEDDLYGLKDEIGATSPPTAAATSTAPVTVQPTAPQQMIRQPGTPRLRADVKAAHDARRMRNLLLLAAALIVIPLMPDISEMPGSSGPEVSWPALEALEESDVPFLVPLVLIYPLLAGVGVLVAALALRNAIGSIVLILLGAAFVAAVAVESGPAMDYIGMAMPPADGGDPGATLALTLLLCMLAGMLLLYTSTRVRSYRGTCEIAWAFGLAGAGLWLIPLLAPLWPNPPMPSSFLPAVYYEALSQPGAPVWMKILSVAPPVAFSLAAVLCLVNTRGRMSAGMALGGWFAIMGAFLLMVGQAMASGMWAIHQLSTTFGGTVDWYDYYTVAAYILKGVAIVLVILLLAVGLADLLIHLPLRRAEIKLIERKMQAGY